jgi:hypothetical protein
MNNLAIGRQREREVARILVAQGIWSGYWQPTAGKFSPTDIFGQFDFVGYDSEGRVVFVQVVKHSFRKGRLERMRAFMRETSMQQHTIWYLVTYKTNRHKQMRELTITKGGETEDGRCDVVVTIQIR